jgi:uncharacterized membrane protein
MAAFILVSNFYSLVSMCFLNTLGTGYLNCLYAYKRKSASPLLNVLTATRPTTLTLLPITSSKHGLHSFVQATMTVYR